MNYQEAKLKSEVLKALANPVRMLIVDTLQNGEQCVQDLNKLAKINQSNISRHLAVLKKAGIVADRRTRTKVFYRLEAPETLGIFQEAGRVMQSDARQRMRKMKSLH